MNIATLRPYIRLSCFLSRSYSRRSLYTSSVVGHDVVNNSTPKTTADNPPAARTRRHLVFDNRSPSFEDFLRNATGSIKPSTTGEHTPNSVPYLGMPTAKLGEGSKFYIEVYGCQMNVNDTEILLSILNKSGYQRTMSLEDADVIFLMTCAIREGAENKIWQRLNYFKHLKTKQRPERPPLVGVLGCMAERLKTKLLDSDKMVDIVCGPDAYRSIPHLLTLAETTHQGVANVMLSADETYADIMPVRLNEDGVSAHISIMRGCNNMCSFCIVPFTRGTERSRPVDSIVDEVRKLSEKGVMEVTLLGQNVNSYRDTSESSYFIPQGIGSDLSNPGFSTIYRRKEGGLRFTELLDRVSLVNPEMRIRFTSPHPKDFPHELLHLIAERRNICSNIHLPVQSGSTSMLERMRRGYSREAYLELAQTIRNIIPGVTLSTDLIAGFCEETEEEHRDTLSMMEEVQYEMAYMFAYSMREKTHAHRRLKDTVPEEVKLRRLREIIETFHRRALPRNQALIGSRQLVLIEGQTKKGTWQGRTDGNHKFFMEDESLGGVGGDQTGFGPGDYVEVNVTGASSTSLRGVGIRRVGLQEFYKTASPIVGGLETPKTMEYGI
ncbi:uncharacterized protein VTP21DRAFT_9379 [Calcarisporiella thermophila]|uniref:uncharacterized protein n=1 Tax=Calcarisporiella thermophila TaxID=911321 RepID=UPI0037427695